METRPVGVELFHGQTDRRTDVAKLHVFSDRAS